MKGQGTGQRDDCAAKQRQRHQAAANGQPYAQPRCLTFIAPDGSKAGGRLSEWLVAYGARRLGIRRFIQGGGVVDSKVDALERDHVEHQVRHCAKLVDFELKELHEEDRYQ